MRPQDLLSKAPFFYHDEQFGVMKAGGVVDLYSEVLDICRFFPGYVRKSREIDGLPLLCDEFAVDVHLDALQPNVNAYAFVATPVNGPNALTFEVYTPATGNFAVVEQPEDLAAPLGFGYGVHKVWTPGVRGLRFHVHLEVQSITGAFRNNITMQVTGRIRNQALLQSYLDDALRLDFQENGIPPFPSEPARSAQDVSLSPFRGGKSNFRY